MIPLPFLGDHQKIPSDGLPYFTTRMPLDSLWPPDFFLSVFPVLRRNPISYIAPWKIYRSIHGSTMSKLYSLWHGRIPNVLLFWILIRILMVKLEFWCLDLHSSHMFKAFLYDLNHVKSMISPFFVRNFPSLCRCPPWMSPSLAVTATKGAFACAAARPAASTKRPPGDPDPLYNSYMDVGQNGRPRDHRC